MSTKDELERALLAELQLWWGGLNDRLFGGEMRPPVLMLRNTGRHLGSWERQSRHLALSRSFTQDAPWGEVIEGLKHEMAHQYVDEVIGMTDETAHGPTFREVCAERGIDGRAAGVPVDGTEGSHARSRVVGRIQKLLALAESPEQNEAEAAMRAARRLLLKHNLSLAEARTETSATWHPSARIPTLSGCGDPRQHFFVSWSHDRCQPGPGAAYNAGDETDVRGSMVGYWKRQLWQPTSGSSRWPTDGACRESWSGSMRSSNRRTPTVPRPDWSGPATQASTHGWTAATIVFVPGGERGSVRTRHGTKAALPASRSCSTNPLHRNQPGGDGCWAPLGGNEPSRADDIGTTSLRVPAPWPCTPGGGAEPRPPTGHGPPAGSQPRRRYPRASGRVQRPVPPRRAYGPR